MLQRLYLSLVLSLLLGFAQQLAATHAYEHTEDWLESGLVKKEVHSASQVCAKCFALANLHNAVGSSYQAIAPAASRHVTLAQAKHLFVVPVLFAYNPRAPPFPHIV